uniref:Uncharacterized protein n=1 Tax=Rhizophora mucronata TaxID=61149 RepID=A0A2P2PSB5_RHIMU
MRTAQLAINPIITWGYLPMGPYLIS